MKTIKSIILFITLALALQVSASTKGDNDFVGKMMERINAKSASYPSSEYNVVTITPAMMSSVMTMISSGAIPTDKLPKEKQEQMANLMKSVKSIRLFVTNTNVDNYQNLINKVLSANKSIYKKYNIEDNDERAQEYRVWTRSSGKNVVEIIGIITSKDNSQKLQIVNVTGDFDDDFISLLKTFDM